MKLSEAMEKGNARLMPVHNYYITFFDGNECGCAVGSCLVGGGYEVKFKTPRGENAPHGLAFMKLREMFPQVEKMPWCPVCQQPGGYMYHLTKDTPEPQTQGYAGSAIECLYETHQWPKERILEWIKDWEKTLEPKPDMAGDGIHAAGIRSEVKAFMSDIIVPKEETHGQEVPAADRPQVDERAAEVLEGPRSEGARA